MKTEEDPLDPDPPAAQRQTLQAIRHLERAVLNSAPLEPVILRYGSFYGAGASEELVALVSKRKLPIVGSGTGVWSFIHIEDAAAATVSAVESDVTGIFNIVDDEPAPVSQWLPFLAEAVGAKPPHRDARLAGAARGWRGGGVAVDSDPRRLQRESQAGAGLAARSDDLAGRVPSRPHRQHADVGERDGRQALAG